MIFSSSNLVWFLITYSGENLECPCHHNCYPLIWMIQLVHHIQKEQIKQTKLHYPTHAICENLVNPHGIHATLQPMLILYLIQLTHLVHYVRAYSRPCCCDCFFFVVIVVAVSNFEL